MKWLWRSLLGILLLALAGALWFWLNPSQEKIIRTQSHRLAAQISFAADESDLTRLGKVGGITKFFTEEVEVKLAFRQFTQRDIVTHETIQAGAAGLRQALPSGLRVEFLDINVALAANPGVANAGLTFKATTPGDNQVTVQEMKFALRKQNDTWLVYQVETVRTLN